VQAVGKTTKELCALGAGGSIRDVVGPLGTPTPIDRHGIVACVGGGVGTAELYPIARALKEAGNTVQTIIGARSQELVILENEMRDCSDSLVVTTDDGSAGRKGFVTDALKDLLDSPTPPAAVFAIGPLPMMKAVSSLTRPYGVRTLVSLNTIMVDGTGMCGGCRVSVGGQMKFACVDGPEFDGHKVDFDELMMRNRTYVDLEKISADRHECKLAAAMQGAQR
jgi:ferredoxin--NADP+ reductase